MTSSKACSSPLENLPLVAPCVNPGSVTSRWALLYILSALSRSRAAAADTTTTTGSTARWRYCPSLFVALISRVRWQQFLARSLVLPSTRSTSILELKTLRSLIKLPNGTIRVLCSTPPPPPENRFVSCLNKKYQMPRKDQTSLQKTILLDASTR